MLKCFIWKSNLFRIRNTLSQSMATMIYKIMILSLYDYCDIFYCGGVNHILRKLQVLQNRGGRIIAKVNIRTCATDIS